MQAQTSPGRARLPAAALSFEGLSLAATAAWAEPGLPERVTLDRLQVALASPAGGWNTTIGASGTATRTGDQAQASLALTLDHMALGDLARLWPAAWGGHARPWIVENVTAGAVRDGTMQVGVSAKTDGTGLRLTSARGSLQGDDVTIHWLRPVPPIEHAQALLTIEQPDVIDIAISSARQGAAQLSAGSVRIRGMTEKDQFLAIRTKIQAAVPDVLTLLRHRRLRLLDRHPIPIRAPAGQADATLTVTLPLEGNLQFEQVDIHAEGRLTALRLGGIAAGRTWTAAT